MVELEGQVNTLNNLISLGHGGGGRLARDLIKKLFLKYFNSPKLSLLGDAAILEHANSRLAFTTDSYIVKPVFFPGGDIGKLAVCGTINDLAVSGATPVCLSLSLIMEEGFPLADLERIIISIKQAAENAGVDIVTGDTKVVEKGRGDGIFINTAGIGAVESNIGLGINKISKGDQIILSGGIGEHGLAVISRREGFDFESEITSDCAPLHGVVKKALSAGAVNFMRDPTRGGLAAVLNEIAEDGNLEIIIDENSVPVRDDVRGICDILGLDPFYIANEGKVVIITPAADADRILNAIKCDPCSNAAAIIGEIEGKGKGGAVYLKTPYGGTRILDMPFDDPLPRIC